jgi:NTP pyrophosphatase (non-canonical NTP hydrolase)
MRQDLTQRVDEETKRAIAKWGGHDQIPDNLISAAAEELGEAAHAFNHNDGVVKAQQEIVHTIGVLVRLYDMAETYTKDGFPISPVGKR